MNLLWKTSNLLQMGAIVAIFAIVGVTLYDVAQGALTGRPLRGAYDVVATCLAFVIYFSVPEVFRTESNIRIDLIDIVLPPRMMSIVVLLGRVLTLAFALLISVAIISPFREAIEYGDVKYESGIPVWFIWLPILGGSFLAVVASAAKLISGGSLAETIED
jgi:TRAP-type C4-dicarboxylate transport system permease small subunit